MTAVETPGDNSPGIKSAQHWKDELRRYNDDYEPQFLKRGEKIVERYRDKRTDRESGETRFNILWSNVRTLKQAIFAKIPNPEVSRRFKDENPAARCAAQIIERGLSYEITQFDDYRIALSNVIDDRLIVGRGIAWVRYEPVTESTEITVDNDAGERITSETSPVDYIAWRDFAHDPARTWEEVTWIARRVFMTTEEVVERFGEDFKNVPLTSIPKDKDKEKANAVSKAQIWEIWDKSSRCVYWTAEGYDKILDYRQDPLGLEEFWPCPRPLYATTTTDSLVPVADYLLYQDQAEELNEVSERIRLLTKSLQVKALYPADEESIQRLLKEGKDGDMIPVKNWQALSEKGGLERAIAFMPLGDIHNSLAELYKDREALKQTIYEITGISDIVRGATDAAETATAQQIKSQFASIRLNEMKNEVARFATALLRMKAEIMCKHYQPETLIEMSGMANTLDAQYIPQALQLLKNGALRDFNIDIESDSLIEIDAQKEKADRLEFMQVVSGYLDKAVQAVQLSPTIAPLAGQLLLFGIRGFKIGESLESEFEKFIQQTEQQLQQQQANPQPTPDQQKLQADQQQKQIELQANQALEQQRLQSQIDLEKVKMQFEHEREQYRLQVDSQLNAEKMEFERWKAELQAATEIEKAKVAAQNINRDINILEGE